jgi:pentatricopeptide repeat protein
MAMMEMRPRDGLKDHVAFVALLKECGTKKDLRRGIELHGEALQSGLFRENPYVGSSLISMYAKCGDFGKAQQVLGMLPNPNAVSWNALISGYAACGDHEGLLDCFRKMCGEGVRPHPIAFAYALKACGRASAIDVGRGIHRDIMNNSVLAEDLALQNALVDMYARCGMLAKAKELLEGLPIRDIISWSALMAGYTMHGRGEEAIEWFEQMQKLDRLSPDSIAFACILKACGIAGVLDKGKQIHADVAKKGLVGEDAVLGNALVDMYAKCGAFVEAQQVLIGLPIRDVISWTALVSGYVQHDQCEEALKCLETMQQEGISPNPITFVCILKACGKIGAADQGKQVHDEVICKGLVENNTVLGNSLVDMYAKCGSLIEARQMFDRISTARDIVLWTTLTLGYCQQDRWQEAINFFERMQCEGTPPNAIAFVCILKVCGDMPSIEKGKQIHSIVHSKDSLGKDLLLCNALLDMYAKSGMVDNAQGLLLALPARDVVSWSVVIAGYCKEGRVEEALECLETMESEGLSPDSVTFTCILNACGSTCALGIGTRIHNELTNKAMLGNDTALDNALVDMYSRCGAITEARNLLCELPSRDVFSWSTLIIGYAQRGQDEEVIDSYKVMHEEGLFPDAITIGFILRACGNTGAMDVGRQIHEEIVHKTVFHDNVLLNTALIDMYAKCGSPKRAKKVLHELCRRDVVSWSALISGYAQLGRVDESLDCFKLMLEEGHFPNAVTFLSLLNACSHAGLVDEGESLFVSIREEYGITPNVELYTCMVDLFGRAGHFDKALMMISNMQSLDYAPVWGSLMNACQKWGHTKLARVSFEHAISLDKSTPTPYICMQNIYMAAGMQEDAEIIEAMRAHYVNRQ